MVTLLDVSAVTGYHAMPAALLFTQVYIQYVNNFNPKNHQLIPEQKIKYSKLV